MSAEKPFGADPMDQYSVPTLVEDFGLVKRFVMPRREKPDKPGRSLTVLWDGRRPLVDGFSNSYDYLMRSTEPGGVAGNHYHQEKHELFLALSGVIKVYVEDTGTKERQEFTLEGGDNTFLYIAPPLAHAVVFGSESDMLLVIASSPNVEGDEFPYQIV